MQKAIIFFIILLLSIVAKGQNKNDTLRKAVQKALADKFPSARMFDVQFQQYLPTDFESELNGNDFEKGEITNHSKVKAIVNLPIYKKPRFMLTGTLSYRYEHFDLNDVQDLTGNTAAPYNYSAEFHYFSTIVSFTYYAKLFKKPLVYNASFIADGSNKGYERIKGMIAASLVLKKTERTTMTAGLLVNIDPTAPIPLSPIFTLEHKFQSNPWTFDLILPQRILFKRPLLENGRISVGTEMGGDGFYIYPNQTGYKNVYEYRQLELKSGITYEYNLGNGLLSTFKTGLSNVFNSRISERGQSTNDYIWKSKQDAAVYFLLGFSYNPFSKPKK